MARLVAAVGACVARHSRSSNLLCVLHFLDTHVLPAQIMAAICHSLRVTRNPRLQALQSLCVAA